MPRKLRSGITMNGWRAYNCLFSSYHRAAAPRFTDDERLEMKHPDTEFMDHY